MHSMNISLSCHGFLEFVRENPKRMVSVPATSHTSLLSFFFKYPNLPLVIVFSTFTD